MNKIGIMQPYLFPYIGYFQLISAADCFVIHDDVQWISGGWINRNRILMQGESCYITLPLRKASSMLPINQRELGGNVEREKQKIMRRLKGAYCNAPYFEAVFDLVGRCFANEEKNVALFITDTLAECCRYLDITTPFVYSSSLGIPNELKAAERVIEINRAMNATHYINPIGGTELYDKEAFAEQGLQLSFLKTKEVQYPQATRAFVPNLSIIDVLMFNSKEDVAKLLKLYSLV